MKLGDTFIGKRLIVGDPTIPGGPVGLGRGKAELRGGAYVEAPMIVGDDTKFPLPEATMMIGRCTNLDAAALIPGLFRIRNLIPGTETPQDVVIGDPSGPVGVTVFCGLSFFTVEAAAINLVTIVKTQLSTIVDEIEAIKSDIGVKVFAGAKTELGVDSNIAAAFNMVPLSGPTLAGPYIDYKSAATSLNKTFGIAVSKKPFDILHPTKEGHRLRYVSLEGPSAEVYVRGKLKDSNTIELPDYWKGLVDPESITVTLTPIGTFQELFYEEVEWCSTIKVMNAAGGPVNCSYTVFAERKDTSKNVPEYKGLTPLDYPGDNDEYRL
tara:strand:+ start:5418 stop:6389 length:972 start_codon:yes stop_codon:yes gene_type:complete